MPGFCSPLEQPALLTALTQHPASQIPCFCSGTFRNSPASISCSLSLFQLSGLSVPKFSFPETLGPFWLEPCGMAKTWPHLSPAAQTNPPRPTCKAQSILLLQDPSRSPPVIVSLLARTERLVLSTLGVNLWQRGEKHFSATVLGKARKSGEDLGCRRVLHRRGYLRYPTLSTPRAPSCRVTDSPRLTKLDAVLAPE